MGEFNTLKNRVDKLENSNASLKKAYGDLEKKLSGLKLGGNDGANQEQVDRLSEELERLRTEFEQHRDQANQNIDNLNHEMPHKADK